MEYVDVINAILVIVLSIYVGIAKNAAGWRKEENLRLYDKLRNARKDRRRLIQSLHTMVKVGRAAGVSEEELQKAEGTMMEMSTDVTNEFFT